MSVKNKERSQEIYVENSRAWARMMRGQDIYLDMRMVGNNVGL